MKHEEFNSTRVGPYLWDIDMDSMELDELRALERLAREKRKQKEAEQLYLNRLKELIEEAKENNVQLVYSSDESWINLSATTNMNNLCAQEKDYWVK